MLFFVLILLTGVSCLLFKYPLILSSLIPSIYRRSAVQIISFLFLPYLVLTGVLCPFVQVLFALSSLASLFNRSAARIWSSLIPFLNRSGSNIYLPFNLKVSQCSLSLVSNGVFSTLFSFVLFFSRISQPRKVLWFHSFVKGAT